MERDRGMPTAKEHTKRLAKRLAVAAAAERRTKLTPRQAKFVEVLASDEVQSKKQAAIQAGYSERSAHVEATRTLKRDNVQAALATALERRVTKLEMTREASAQRLFDLAEQARALGQLAVAARCEELAGRLHGLYVERSENVNVNVELARMSPAQLREIAGQLAQRLASIAGSGNGSQDVQVIDLEGQSD
jgi:phage terminase small subunit